jgi:MFS family permease
MFSSLRHRDYRFLWAGTLCMSAGQWIQQVTLGWLLYDLTGSAVLLGALNGLRALPFLFIGPLAGVAADRFDRMKMIISAQGVLVVTALVMGVLVATGTVQAWHLFVFTGSTSIVWAAGQTVRQTLVANVVPRQDLLNAVTLNSMGFNTTKVIGPAVGGLLIATFGAGGNFFVQAAAYAGVMATFAFIHLPPSDRSHVRQASVAANLREGFDYVRTSPVVLGLMLTALIPNVFAMPVYQALLPIFQKDVLGLGPEALGLLLAAPGVGAVAATFFLAAVASTFARKGVLMLGGLMVLGVCLIVFAYATSLPLALLALTLVGFSQMTFLTTAQSLLQLLVPDALRGRVMSLYQLDHGIAPLGALLAGISTALIGAPYTVAIGGLLVLLLAITVATRVPTIRQLRV